MESKELDKWGNHLQSRELIDGFLDMLIEQGIELGEWSKEYTSFMLPTLKMRDELLDEFFDINRNQLEKERQELLLEYQTGEKQ